MATLTIIPFPNEPEALDIKADPGYVAGDNVFGDEFQNDGRTGVFIENSSGGPITVTLEGARLCSHGVLHDAVVAVPNLFEGFVALELQNDRFSNAAGVASIAYSGAGLNVAAVRRL